MIKEPKDNVAACEDFILLVTEAHILAAAMTVFNMKSLDDAPTTVHIPDNSEDLCSLQRRRNFTKATRSLVDTFVDISFFKEEASSRNNDADLVRAYACSVMTHGLLLMEFNDAIKEGDGDRILRCWSYFMIIFKTTDRRNYCIEAFNMLMQYHFIFPPRLAAQLKWNRTVNVHGRPGKNIACDLHMEHLNREAKSFMGGLGANICNQSVTRIGRALKPLITAMENFDKQHQVPTESGNHTRRSSEKDLQTVLEQIFVKSNVFHFSPGRMHAHFRNFCPNTMTTVTEENFKKWMEHRAKELLTYH